MSTKHYTNTVILLLILCSVAMLTAMFAVVNSMGRKRKAPKDVIRAMEEQGNEDDNEDDDDNEQTQTKKKFHWETPWIEQLFLSLAEYRTICTIEAKDLNTDKPAMYRAIHVIMAKKIPQQA